MSVEVFGRKSLTTADGHVRQTIDLPPHPLLTWRFRAAACGRRGPSAVKYTCRLTAAQSRGSRSDRAPAALRGALACPSHSSRWLCQARSRGLLRPPASMITQNFLDRRGTVPVGFGRSGASYQRIRNATHGLTRPRPLYHRSNARIRPMHGSSDSIPFPAFLVRRFFLRSWWSCCARVARHSPTTSVVGSVPMKH